MTVEVRFDTNQNRLFHREHNLFYVIGGAEPTTKSLNPLNALEVNTGSDSGGEATAEERGVRLSGGGAMAQATMNIEVKGTVVVGTIFCVVFPDIKITSGGVEAVEEVTFQYTVQSGDTLSSIASGMADTIMNFLDNVALPVGGNVRSSNPLATDAEIRAGMTGAEYYEATAGPGTEAAVATAANLVISATAGTFGNDRVVCASFKASAPSTLSFSPEGIPLLNCIRHFGCTRGVNISSSGTEAEILCDQLLPKFKTHLSAQTSSVTFELVEDDSLKKLEIISGISRLSNDSTRDYLMPAAKTTQGTYSLIFVAPSEQVSGQFDYLWLYRGRSAQLDLVRELRTHNAVSVTFSPDSLPNRADVIGHYSIPYKV